MTQRYRTLRVARSDEGVLSVVIDAPPMNLIGPELVRDLVILLSELESEEDIRVMVLESADPEYFVPPSTPMRPNGTAGSTGRCPTPNWTRSWPDSRDASRRSPPMRCDPPSRSHAQSGSQSREWGSARVLERHVGLLPLAQESLRAMGDLVVQLRVVEREHLQELDVEPVGQH
jgi:hypothetical protein